MPSAPCRRLLVSGLLASGLALPAGCAGRPLRTSPAVPPADRPVAGTLSGAEDAWWTDATATEALLATDRAFASECLVRGAPAAFATFTTAGVVDIPASGAITGTRAELLARFATMGRTVLTWEPQQAAASGGAMGLTLGEWALHQGGAAGAILTRGRYLTVWQRQADGAWRVAFDIANTASPAGPAPAPTNTSPVSARSFRGLRLSLRLSRPGAERAGPAPGRAARP